MEVLNTGYLPPTPGWALPDQCHDDRSELIIVLSGQMELSTRSQSRTVKTGDVCLYPAGAVHSEESDKKDPVELVYIVFSSCNPDETHVRTIRDRTSRFRRLGRFMQEARQNAAAPGLDKKYAEIILQEFLSRHTHNENQNDNSIVTTIRSYMLQNLDKPVSNGELAYLVSMSKYHFSRTFKELTGHTPQDEFRRLRSEEAANLLKTTDLPLRVIGPMTGFADEYHFSRVFKKVMGVTPGKFRKMN